MNEYGFSTYEDGSYQDRVHHVQLVYASYAALLALFEITSLLGVGMNEGAKVTKKIALPQLLIVCWVPTASESSPTL
jgi:predicted Na+-dependent transporter